MEWSCKNCFNVNEEFYCSKCGQKNIDEISWPFVVTQAQHAFELENGFLYNFKVFTISPARAVREYLNGKTKTYLNPVSYMLIGLSLLFISTQLVNNENVSEKIIRSAEVFVYIFATTFPLFFGLVLYGAQINERPEFIKGFIISFFLIGHILIIHTLLRTVLFICDLLIPINSDVVFLLSYLMALYFLFTFSKGYLKKGLFSTVKNITLSFIAVTFLIGMTIGMILNIALAFGYEYMKKSFMVIGDFGDLAEQVVKILTEV